MARIRSVLTDGHDRCLGLIDFFIGFIWYSISTCFLCRWIVLIIISIQNKINNAIRFVGETIIMTGINYIRTGIFDKIIYLISEILFSFNKIISTNDRC